MEKEVKLSVQDLHLNFGGLQALNGVSLEVRNGELCGIIGPNGAGKSSLFNCIGGFYRPQRGEIFFNSKKISGRLPYRIAEMGIARTFQNIELYSGLSTLDNLMEGRHIRMRRGILANAIYFGPSRNEEIEHRKTVEWIIDFLEMGPVRKTAVGSLPYGLRKRVELGRALAMDPEMLLLDEPMAGMNVDEKEDMARFIIDISELRGIPIVLIEHDMDVVMDIVDKVIVLDFGQKIAEGSPQKIKHNPLVIKAYLGEEAED